MKKWRYLVGILLILFAVFLCQKVRSTMLRTLQAGTEAKAINQELDDKILIDAGHGDLDPGKVGVNGILEKDINLLVSKKVKKILAAEGIQTQMTRETDESLAKTKIKDLQKRVEFINKETPDLVVSIHQNSYSSESVKGAQVFYYKNSEEGKDAAELLQKEFWMIDPENHRQAKANTSYYLLKNTKVPIVIVECGFLSNYEEAEKLKTDEYQKKIAEAICSGILKYLNVKE